MRLTNISNHRTHTRGLRARDWDRYRTRNPIRRRIRRYVFAFLRYKGGEKAMEDWATIFSFHFPPDFHSRFRMKCLPCNFLCDEREGLPTKGRYVVVGYSYITAAPFHANHHRRRRRHYRRHSLIREFSFIFILLLLLLLCGGRTGGRTGNKPLRTGRRPQDYHIS